MKTVFLVIAFLIGIPCFSQNPQLKQILSDPKLLESHHLDHSKSVSDFYGKINYHLAWYGQRQNNRYFIENAVRHFRGEGLLSPALQKISAFFSDQKPLQTGLDSVVSDVKLTDRIIELMEEIHMPSGDKFVSYNGLNYTPSCISMSAVAAAAVLENKPEHLFRLIEPLTPEYQSMKARVTQMRKHTEDPTFREEKVTSSKADTTNLALIRKLRAFDLLPSGKVTNVQIVEAVKGAQKLFSLLADGKLRSTILAELNISLSSRIQELEIAMYHLRWLNCRLGREELTIILNIPSADLNVYEGGKKVFHSKVIVGKPSTPTHTLSSTVSEVIMYPYWMVPHSIATKEILPSVKRNVNYLNAHNYQVLDKRGRILNPKNINWHSLSTSYFPYIIRQSTGCDNALGIIKLNFYNPFTTYLHDTPSRSLFTLNKRYFSHGCMRVEKAVDLGQLVLQENSIAIDTFIAQGCLMTEKPTVIPVTRKVGVFIVYNTAWFDQAGETRFFENIYRKPRMKVPDFRIHPAMSLSLITRQDE